LRDSQAILVYLARKYAADSWLPTEPAAMAETISWLVVAENDALSHEGGISLERYPAIRAWVGRIKQLPGFISIPAL
jgi:glutathione S-transferase